MYETIKLFVNILAIKFKYKFLEIYYCECLWLRKFLKYGIKKT